VAAVRGRIGTIRASANFNYADYAASAAASKAAAQPPAGQPSAAQPSAATQGVTFHEVLSELNPLQYIPVIGTIYRAMTGDVIPAPVRDAGSMLVSGLLAGPIGVAMDVGELVGEKVTGLDPEKIGDQILAKMGVHVAEPAKASPAEAPIAVARAKPAEASAPSWSGSKLAAYGVTTDSAGNLSLGALQGSDVLNSIELDRLHAQHAQHASARYAATAAGDG
jgi:hypothetical protein